MAIENNDKPLDFSDRMERCKALSNCISRIYAGHTEYLLNDLLCIASEIAISENMELKKRDYIDYVRRLWTNATRNDRRQSVPKRIWGKQ